jgi:tripartite-type tricarboxylate transporter receptor subunit TctC
MLATFLVRNILSAGAGFEVKVEYKQGFSGRLASERVERSRPDGGTILLSTPAFFSSWMLTIGAGEQGRVPPRTSLKPIAMVGREPYALVVRRDLEIENIEDAFQQFQLPKFGKSVYAVPSLFSEPHQIAALVSRKAGLGSKYVIAEMRTSRIEPPSIITAPLDWVDDRGQEPPRRHLSAVAEGKAHYAMDALGVIASTDHYVRYNGLKLLGVSTASPSRHADSVPTLAGPLKDKNFNVGSWFGLFCSPETSQDILSLLAEFVRIGLEKVNISNFTGPMGRLNLLNIADEVMYLSDFGAYLLAENMAFTSGLRNEGNKSAK